MVGGGGDYAKNRPGPGAGLASAPIKAVGEYPCFVVRPEDAARVQIDAALEAAGCVVHDRDQMNVQAGPGEDVGEVPLRTGFGSATE
jgi:hypothetical protein